MQAKIFSRIILVQIPSMAEPVILPAVKPENINLSILCQKFPDLFMTLPAHLQGAFSVHTREKISREAPVKRGIVQAHLQPRTSACIHKFSVCRRMHGGKLFMACRTVPQRKSIMVSGGQNHILHSRRLCHSGPFPRIKIFRGKRIHQLPVFILIDGLFVHGPFSPPQKRIKPPMDKHAEAHFLPFL